MTDMLTRILNTLMMIETKGENTLLMGQCLQALQQVIQQSQEQANDASAPAVAEDTQEA